jgi:hypothetical protein
MKLSKGLYKDTDPIDQLLGTYPNARNMIINKVQGALVNELGFSRIHDLNKKIVGSIPIINDEIIIFSRDDDDATQTTVTNLCKIKVTFPNTMSGTLSIGYTDSAGVAQTDTVDMSSQIAEDTTVSSHDFFVDGGAFITQTNSVASSNLTFTFSIGPSTDSDNVASNLTVAFLQQSSVTNIAYESEIGRLTKDGTYTTILKSDSLKFRSDTFIKGVFVLNFNKEIIISFTDDKTQPKILNIDKLPFEVDSSKKIIDENKIVLMYIFPEFKRPVVSYKEVVDNGGALKTGAYFLSFAYELEDGSRTNFTPLDGPIIVTDSTLELTGSYRKDMQSNFDLVSMYDGAEPNTTSSKSIRFKVSDIDRRYKYLLFAVYKKIGGNTTSELIQKIEIQSVLDLGDSDDSDITVSNAEAVNTPDTANNDVGFSITYSGRETTVDLLLEDISVGNETYSTAKTITYFDSKLFLGNLTSHEDFNYQPYAMNIQATWTRDYIDVNSVRGSYKDELMVYNKRGFRPDEVYAFYIAFLYNDGTWSGAYHIPGRDKDTVTVSLEDADGTYLTPVTISEDIKLKDIVLGDVTEGTITSTDRIQYQDIFQHDLGISKDARWFQTRETAGIDGKMGYWRNETELYPGDKDTFGSSAGKPVRHHKFPGYEAMNGLNTTFIATDANGNSIQPGGTGTGHLIVIAYMDSCMMDLNPNVDGDELSVRSYHNRHSKSNGFNQIYNRERVYHHLYLYVPTGNGQAAPGYYFLAQSLDPRDFTESGGAFVHYLTDAKIEISGDQRRGDWQHSVIPPQNIVNGTNAINDLYPNMLTPRNTDRLSEGLDYEYEGTKMNDSDCGYDDDIPSLPMKTEQEYYYINGGDPQYYASDKVMGHWYHKHCRKEPGVLYPCIYPGTPKSQAFIRRWGEKRHGHCRKTRGYFSSWEYNIQHLDIISGSGEQGTGNFTIIPSWWSSTSNQVSDSSLNGNGIKTLRKDVEYNFSSSLGNYLQPSFITSQPYGATGNAQVKQNNYAGAPSLISSSTLSPITFESFHTGSPGLANAVAQSPLTSSSQFATTKTGNTPDGFFSNNNYTYEALGPHTLFISGKFGCLVESSYSSGSEKKPKQIVISGIRKLRRGDPDDQTTWERTDVFKNTETNTGTLKASGDKVSTSTLGGNFLTEDIENVFRPDLFVAISLNTGDILQFYHETTVSGLSAVSHSDANTPTKIAYEYDLQFLTYQYTIPTPNYSPYSMYTAVLGIRFNNIELPRELAKDIQGYQFFYAERDAKNTQTFDQSIAFHGAPHALYPDEEGSYAGHLIPMGNLRLTGSNEYGDTGSGYTGSDWSQEGLTMDGNDFSKQHKINPSSFRFHGFNTLNFKPTIQSAYIKRVSELGSCEYTDVRLNTIVNANDLNAGVDTANVLGSGSGNEVYFLNSTTTGKNNTIDTILQAGYNQIWNRYSTSTTAQRNPSFSLASNHYYKLRQLQDIGYVPADTVVTKKSVTINNTYSEECLHASIVHYDNETKYSEINHHTGFANSSVSGGVTTYTEPMGWRKIKSNYELDNGNQVIDQIQGPKYNLVDLKSYKTNLYNSFYDQKFIATKNYFRLTNSEKLEIDINQSIIKSTGPIFGGDTYTGMYGIRLTGPAYYSKGKNVEIWSSSNKLHAVKNIFFFPVYTAANVSLRHSATQVFKDSYYPRCGVGSLSNSGETTTVNSRLDQKKQALHNYRGRTTDIENTNTTTYNQDYSSLNSYNVITAYDNRNLFLGKFPYRIIRSQSFGQEDKTMSLKEFKTNDYYEMVKNRGHLVNLEGVGKELIIHHEHSIFKTTTKDVIATDTAQATLGTGDIFQFAPTELITSENGYAGTQHLSSVLISKAGYSFVDAEQGKVFLVNNKLQEISSTGLRQWFRDNLAFQNTTALSTDTPFNLGGSGYVTAFDELNNRLLLTKKDLKLNVSLVTDVQVPTTFRAINPVCQIDSDGNSTGFVIYQNIEEIDQYGNVMNIVANESSHEAYQAPVINNILCPGKPQLYLEWVGPAPARVNKFEGEQVTLKAVIDEAQEGDITVTVAYSGTYNQAGIPGTSIVIPSGSLEGTVTGAALTVDQVVELTPDETIIATSTSITRDGGVDESNNPIVIQNAATDIGGPASVKVLDCPVLVNDSISGITFGGSVDITTLTSNDSAGSIVANVPIVYKIASLPKDSSNNVIGTLTDNNNSNAALTVGSTITQDSSGNISVKFTHAGGSAATSGSFTYSASKGPCSSVATVDLGIINVDSNTYIVIWFDNSGSMNSTEDDLDSMKNAAYSNTNGLRRLLQDFYATGNTEGSGNTNTTTNGADLYNAKVKIIDYTGQTPQAGAERTFNALNYGGAGFGTGSSDSFPDASKVIIFAFQDEASFVYHDNNSFATRTSQYNTDIAALRTTISSLNSSDSSFYRANVFQVATGNTGQYANFKSFLQAVQNGTGNYSGTNGLSDMSSNVGFTYDVVPNNDNSTTSGYYTNLIKTAMENLGYTF